jgi:hypothetical protein
MESASKEKVLHVASTGKEPEMGRIQKLTLLLQALKAEKFTGYVKLSYGFGQLRSIETFEEVLK